MDKPDFATPPPLLTRLQATFLQPGLFLSYGIYNFFVALIQSPFLAIRDFQTFRHKSFSRFWKIVGKAMSEDMPGDSMDLLAAASGVVLDLGPGTGELLYRFNPELIVKAYGPEPAIDMHPALQKNIDKAGLTGKYEILTSGAEPDSLIPALAKKGVIKAEGLSTDGIFDTICCIRVLCGIPHTEETIKELYRLLKPGGKMIVAEHVVSPWPRKGSVLGFIMQKVLLLFGWNLWMGGCNVNKDTLSMLEKAGGKNGWKEFNLRYVASWSAIPFIVGKLIKA